MKNHIYYQENYFCNITGIPNTRAPCEMVMTFANQDIPIQAKSGPILSLSAAFQHQSQIGDKHDGSPILIFAFGAHNPTTFEKTNTKLETHPTGN